MNAMSLRVKERRPPVRRLRLFWRRATAHKSLSILFTGSVLLLAACETTDKTGGSQEAKRQAAIDRHRQQQPIDQSDANLWNAQQNVLNRDSNPTRSY